MFYKIAKALSKVTIIFGFVLMVGGGSEKSQELFYLYEALGKENKGGEGACQKRSSVRASE